MSRKQVAANAAVGTILFMGNLALAGWATVLARHGGVNDLIAGFTGAAWLFGVPSLMNWLIKHTGVK